MVVISRNVAYYLNAFKKLDEDRDSWNWAAFCFQGMWMFYRKMYLYGLCSLIIDFAIFLSVTSSSSISSVFGFNFLCNIIYKGLFGYFGNRLYYSVVKDRIFAGYHLMDQYKSTSKSLAILFFFIPAIYFYYFADVLANDAFFKNKSRENTSINEQNIVKYLSQDKTNHIQGKFAIVLSTICYFLSSPFMVSIFESRFKGYIFNTLDINTIENQISIIGNNDHIKIE